MSQHDRYISPFSTRYSSDEMQYIFSDDNKFRTWRRLWIALAKAEQKQGLDITDEQIAELEAHKDDINYEEAIAIVKSWQGEDVLCFEDDKVVFITDGETLYDTSENLSVEDNRGQPTIEIFTAVGKEISNNTSTTKQLQR